jgi:hypothetical protein
MEPIIITDIQAALHKLDDLKFCRFYHKDKINNIIYVYDRLLGYDKTFLSKQ